MELVKNVVPVFGSYRFINKMTQTDGTLGGGNINGSYSHLVTESRTNMLLAPDSDVAIGGWTRGDGTTTDLYAKVNEQVANKASTIKVGNDPTNDVAEFSIDNPERAPKDSSDHIIRMQYETDGLDTGWTLDVDLFDGGTSVLSAARQITDTVDHDWTDFAYTLTSTEVNNFTTYTNPVAADYSDLRIKLTATATSSVSKIRPDSDITFGRWTGNSGEEEDLWDLIDQDASHIKSTSISSGGQVTATFGLADPGFEPDTAGTWTLKMQARVGDGATNDITGTMTLLQGDTVIASFTETAISDSTFVTYSSTMSTAEKAAVTDVTDLRFKFTGTRVGSSANNYRFDVKEAWLEVPPIAAFHVSWLQFEVPDDNTTTVDDVNEVYIGLKADIRKSNGITFNNVTRTGTDYGLGTASVTAWDFCSFGQTLIATNFSDEVQVKGVSDSLFSNLITSTLKPNARYCMAVKGHLVLGDINDSDGASVGQADEIWWSALDDPTSFLEGDQETGSDRQLIFHTPGRITGLTGRGDYGIIWKRDSIVRIDYVGDDIVFDINVISNGIGCPHTQSIVEVGNDIFFSTGFSFARLNGGTSVEIIGEGEVNKHIYDDDFETDAFFQTTTEDPERAEQLIVGAFDRFTGNVWWFYYNRNLFTHIYRKSLAVIYNTRNGQWSKYKNTTEEDAVSQVVPNINIQAKDGPYRGLYMVSTLGNHYLRQFEGNFNYEATLRTSVLGSKSMTGVPNQQFKLIGIRPIIRTENSDDTEYIPGGTSITVYYGDTPEVSTSSSSIVGNYSDANLHGMVPLSITANYIQVEVVVPSVQSLGLRNFRGLEYFFEPAGPQ